MRAAGLDMTREHRWLLDYLERNCKGLANATKRDVILRAMRGAGFDIADSAMRIVKEELIELGYVVCSCNEWELPDGRRVTGYYRPLTREEGEPGLREYGRRIGDLCRKRDRLAANLDNLFNPPTMPGAAPVSGEGAKT